MNAPKPAMPRDMPIWRAVEVVAEATPAWLSGMAASTRFVTGIFVNASTTPAKVVATNSNTIGPVLFRGSRQTPSSRVPTPATRNAAR